MKGLGTITPAERGSRSLPEAAVRRMRPGVAGTLSGCRSFKLDPELGFIDPQFLGSSLDEIVQQMRTEWATALQPSRHLGTQLPHLVRIQFELGRRVANCQRDLSLQMPTEQPINPSPQ